jgi:hypothetical protein
VAFESGLYVVRFGTPRGEGAGVAYLSDGKLRGGDSMMAYVGSYNEANGQLQADVRAYQHTDVPDMESVFGVDEVDIHLTGPISGGNAKLTGTAPQAPGVNLTVVMERLHD